MNILNTTLEDLQNAIDYFIENDTIVNHGTEDTTFALTPNKYHVWGEVASLTLTLDNPPSRYSGYSYSNEYMFRFTSGSTPTVLTLPNTIKWMVTPTIKANRIYQVSIQDNIAIIAGVSTT